MTDRGRDHEAGVPHTGAPRAGMPQMGVPHAGVPEPGVPEPGARGVVARGEAEAGGVPPGGARAVAAREPVRYVAEQQLTLRDESDLVVARHHVRRLGQSEGLSAVAIEQLATAVTEIARNVLIHARSGRMAVRSGRALRRGAERAVVAVVVTDEGPGMGDVPAAMADGYSTGAGLGMGLAGARRLVDAFELESAVGQGTTVTLEKWGKAPEDHL